MRRYAFIGAGGFLGAVSRYVLKNWEMLNITEQFQFNTVIINIAGCFILTFFLRLAFDIWEIDPDLRLGITIGFIGAFTTFSAFCRDTVGLLFNGDLLFALLNLLLSVIAGFAAIYLGDISAKQLTKVKE